MGAWPYVPVSTTLEILENDKPRHRVETVAPAWTLGLGREDGAGGIATSLFEHVDDADEHTFYASPAPHWSTVLQVSFLNVYPGRHAHRLRSLRSSILDSVLLPAPYRRSDRFRLKKALI